MDLKPSDRYRLSEMGGLVCCGVGLGWVDAISHKITQRLDAAPLLVLVLVLFNSTGNLRSLSRIWAKVSATMILFAYFH